jgi:hypothetical protein
MSIGKYYITGRIFGYWIGALVGATMLEFQCHRLGITWCYLWGGNWKLWSKDSRLKVHWYEKDQA